MVHDKEERKTGIQKKERKKERRVYDIKERKT